jgi:hypothetical protein
MSHRITFTVHDELFVELERLSIEDGRSLSNLVAFGIEMYALQRKKAEMLKMRASLRGGTSELAKRNRR